MPDLAVAAQVALLALATMAPDSETPVACTLLLPALFAAGSAPLH